MATPFTNAAGEDFVQEVNWNGFADNLTPAVVQVLNDAQKLVDFPITLSSGFRDVGRNAKAGGAKGSEHISGNAVDISLRGLTNEQRTQLTQALVESGAKRLGAYSGNTGLHLDMKNVAPADGYPVWPMFDKSIRNMGNAPDWFISGLSGGPVPPENIPGPPIPADISERLAGLRSGDVPLPRPRPSGERGPWGLGALPPAPPMPRPPPTDRAAAPSGIPPGARMTPEEIAGLYAGILPLARQTTVPNDPRLANAPGALPAVPPRPDFGIVDGIRSPTLFEQPNGSQVVGIPDELDRRAWDERRVDPKQADFGIGGFGSLLDDRLSPGMRNPVPRPPVNMARPEGPVGGLPAAPRVPPPFNAVRPSGPVGGLPPARPVVNAVRPEGPVGSLPAAPRGTTVTSRPDAPVGRLPAAPRPANSPVGSGAPISPTPFSTLPPRPKTQFGGEGMPSLYPFGVTDFQGPDPELLRLMEHNNPPLPRPRPDSPSSSPVGAGQPISQTPFLPPVPRQVSPVPTPAPSVPEWTTVTKRIQNPEYTVYLGQLAANQRMTPTGSVVTADQFRALNDPNYRPPAAPALPPPPARWLTVTERVPLRAPVPAVRRPLVAPIPAMQSEALRKQRLLRPPTVASTTPLQRVSSEQTNPGVGGTTRSMETSTRWTTGY